jgi:hypothetical protein
VDGSVADSPPPDEARNASGGALPAADDRASQR